MTLRFAGTVPKDPQFPNSNEDSIKIDIKCGRIAVSDGASESFASRVWAHFLTDLFIESSNICPAWIDQAIERYNNIFIPSEMSWSQKAAFERGSFATLVGLEYLHIENRIEAISLGDSLIVLISDENVICTHAYNDFRQFQNHPELISTNLLQNNFLWQGDLRENRKRSWDISEYDRPTILLMTDALGEWFLRKVENHDIQWKALLYLSDPNYFERFVLSLRENRQIRTDDTSLVVMDF